MAPTGYRFSHYPLLETLADSDLILIEGDQDQGGKLYSMTGATFRALVLGATGLGSLNAANSEAQTLTGTLALADENYLYQLIDPGGADRVVTLPELSAASNHAFFILNTADATETLTVEDADTNVIGYVTRGTMCVFMPTSTSWKVMQPEKHRIRGFVSNPQAVYAQRAQIVFLLTDRPIVITRIHIHGSDTTPTAELQGDLKYADDVNIGGFANATLIAAIDTTNGVKTITSGFTNAAVPVGKYVYLQMDASPHADWKDFYIEFHYVNG
jgi:hypothetical protein